MWKQCASYKGTEGFLIDCKSSESKSEHLISSSAIRKLKFMVINTHYKAGSCEVLLKLIKNMQGRYTAVTHIDQQVVQQRHFPDAQ